MAQDAIRCPQCSGWRRDIYIDRMKCYGLAGVSGLVIGCSAAAGVWSSSGQGSASGPFIAIGMGLASVAFALGALGCAARVSKKIGTWWWM